MAPLAGQHTVVKQSQCSKEQSSNVIVTAAAQDAVLSVHADRASAELQHELHPPLISKYHTLNPTRRLILHDADQDSVRLLAVESCGAFAAALSKDDCSASLLPVVQKFAQVSQLQALSCTCTASFGT
eukprot:GHRQ01039602.1.p1 GENE.GHRQ01039602.1~~GHRQ01039602.1.p1  ORF type:complete len:128 (-),score=9.36 GHRQ01039602.1:357-740(-)